MVSRGEVEIGSLIRKNSSLDAKQTLQLAQQLKARGLSSVSAVDSLENEAKAISFKIDSKNVDFPNHTSITFISENMFTEDDLTGDCNAFMNATLKPSQLIGPKFTKEGSRRGRRRTQNHIFKLFPNSNAAHNQKIVYERKLRKIDHSEIQSSAARQPLAQSNARKCRSRNRIQYIETGNRTEILNLEQCISLINGKSGAIVQVNENNDPLLTFEQNVRSPFADVLEAGSSATVFEPAVLVSTELVNPQPTPVKDSDVACSENTIFKKENDSEHPGQLCRLCATSGDAMVYIFGDTGVQLDLRKKINSWLPTHVSRTDPLPKQVCSRCIQKLMECHDFAMACAEAEKKLNNLVKRKKFSFTEGIAEADVDGSCLEETKQETKSEQPFSSVEDLDNSICSFVENGDVGTKLQDAFTDREENVFFSEDSSELEVLETVTGDEVSHSNKYGCPLCCEGNMHTVQKKAADVLRPTEAFDRKSGVKESVDEQSCNTTVNDTSIKCEDEAQGNNFAAVDCRFGVKRNHDKFSGVGSEAMETSECDEVKVEYEIPEKKVRVVFENKEPVTQPVCPVACWVCGEVLESLYDCLAHGLQTHGDTEEGIYPCSQCEESFCTSEDMSHHFSSSHFPMLEQSSKRKAGVLEST